jgi:hypothetical protein
MSTPANMVIQPKWPAASSPVRLTTDSFRRRPSASAMARVVTLLGDRVVPRARLAAIDREHVQKRNVAEVRCRPAVLPFAEVGHATLGAGDLDERRD